MPDVSLRTYLRGTLRTCVDMRAQLLAVDEWAALVNLFYPLLLKHAGKELSSLEIVFEIQRAISELACKKPMQHGFYRVSEMFAQWIDAMVEDEALRSEAKSVWGDILQRARAFVNGDEAACAD